MSELALGVAFYTFLGLPKQGGVEGASQQMMVSVQQAGAFAFWQQNQLFPYSSVVPCQWHHHTATTATVPPAAAAAADFAQVHAPVKDSPLNSVSSFVSLPVQQPATHHYHPTTTTTTAASSLLSRGAATVDPEQPIGYGSFGVVW